MRLRALHTGDKALLSIPVPCLCRDGELRSDLEQLEQEARLARRAAQARSARHGQPEKAGRGPPKRE